LSDLYSLSLRGNPLTNFSFLKQAPKLEYLDVDAAQATNLALPLGLTNLTLHLSGNPLGTMSFLTLLPTLSSLDLSGNQLSSLQLPQMTNLTRLLLGDNQLTNFSFLRSVPRLSILDLSGNGLTNLTLPPGLTNLAELLFDTYSDGPQPQSAMPCTLILPEPLALGSLADSVAYFKRLGIAIYEYPLEISIASPYRAQDQAFGFTISGPPAVYSILSSTNLTGWSERAIVTNILGAVNFLDTAPTSSMWNFYEIRSP
jgi:Leucine-rich repeat (LRR) protein